MSVIVHPITDSNCKNCGESTRYYYVALKNGKYSHMFNCKGEQ